MGRQPTGASASRSLLVGWALAAAGLLTAALLLPGLRVDGILGAFLVVAVIGILNALAVPVVAQIRLPFTVLSGFLVVLVLDAAVLWIAAGAVGNSIVVDTFGWALAGALAAAAATLVFQIALGVNNDDTYSLRVIERMARRSGEQVHTDKPGIVFVEIDGLAYPVLQRALRDGHAPEMARWLAAGTHQLVEWETDLSSQTGASQAGILLGSNDDIPAFRWVEKETGTLMTCSAPGDCEEIERRHTNGSGLLVDGGTSRGNLLSGGAEEVILTVSRIKAERKANPGYRAFFANGHNVTRVVALFIGEVVHRGLGRCSSAAARRAAARTPGRYLSVPARGDVRFPPRPHRLLGDLGHAPRPSRRLRDAVELRRGGAPLRPRAARHARDAPQARQAARANRTGGPTRSAPVRDRRPLRSRADAGRDVQAAQRLRARRPRSRLDRGAAGAVASRRRRERDGGRARARRGARRGPAPPATTARRRNSTTRRSSCSARATSASIYLMEARRRLTLEEIEDRHPRLVPSSPRSISTSVSSSPTPRTHGPVALGARGTRYLRENRVRRRGPARRLLGERSPPSRAYQSASSMPRICSSTASTTNSSTRAALSRS